MEVVDTEEPGCFTRLHRIPPCEVGKAVVIGSGGNLLGRSQKQWSGELGRAWRYPDLSANLSTVGPPAGQIQDANTHQKVLRFWWFAASGGRGFG